MTKILNGIAMSRRDGSDQDGIHLLWSPPDIAGYSVNGFDIQRRKSKGEDKIDCYAFTPAQLDQLHLQFRLEYPQGTLSLRQAPCPTFPETPPDEEFEPQKPETCVDFSKMPKGRFPNPRFEEGLEFRVYGDLRQLTSRRNPLLPHTEHLTSRGIHGLNGGFRTEIFLPAQTDQVSFELALFSKSLSIRVLGKDKVLHTEEITGDPGKVKSFKYAFPGMTRLQISAPQNKWLLVNICYSAPVVNCFEFSQQKPGSYANPLKLDGYSATTFDHRGKQNKTNSIRDWEGKNALDIGHKIQIELPKAVREVDISMIHFSSPPALEAIDANGNSVEKKQLEIPPKSVQTVTFRSEKAFQTIVLHAPQNEALLLSVCTSKQRLKLPGNLASLIGAHSPLTHLEAIPPSPAAANTESQLYAVPMAYQAPKTCVAYTIEFNKPHTTVQITAGLMSLMAIAFREGKAVQVETRSGAGPHNLAFENKVVDKVVIYANSRLRSLTVCVNVPLKEKEEAKDWAQVPYLVKGLQMPLQSVNPALGNGADEDNLAFNRITPSESLSLDAFHQASLVLNPAGNKAKFSSPVEYFTLSREEIKEPFIDLQTWPYGLGTLLSNTWRRIMGFGYLDKGDGLVPGELYDYRVSGYFRRRDIEEEFLGFRIVPKSTLLPPGFRLGPVFFNTFKRTEVEFLPKENPGSLVQGGIRKGIWLEPEIPGGKSLKLKFDEPISSLVLEIAPETVENFKYDTSTSIFFPVLPQNIFADAVPADHRVLLIFADPIDQITFFGKAFLYGIRINPVGDTVDADQLVQQSFIVSRIRYESTARPAAPPFLSTQNLQQPASVGNPEAAVKNPKEDMGFRLKWLPPASGPNPIIPWPEDLGAFPPFDVLAFHLERRPVTGGGAFKPIDEEDTLYMGSRSGEYEIPPIAYGADVIDLFQKASLPQPPISPWMEAHDVLRSSAEKEGIPGNLYQYRIFSIDVLGRKSAVATLGSIVRLEKRLAPPQPVAPSTPVPDGVRVPSGLRAYALQASDPNISAASAALLGASSNAVVLEWGWNDEQREMDPFATEFRVYWQSIAPDRVEGQLVGAANLVGGFYQMAAQLNQSVPANTFKGRYITAGGYPFKVAGHTAGQNINFRLEPTELRPGLAPGNASFRLSPVLDGTEQRPSRWEKRVATVPITASKNYRYIFRDQMTLDADHPFAHHWMGVSACDDQYYIPDELPGAALNGNRPGNESSIGTAQVRARYIGKPVFTVPDPLANVPEVLTKEPVSGEISLRVNLPALFAGSVTIPAGHKVIVEQLPISAIIVFLGASAGGQFQASFPGQPVSSYTLGNPGDQANFLAQIRSGEPASIEGKFLMDFFIRYRDRFSEMWVRSLPDPVPFAAQNFTFPSEPERYIFRIRLVDKAGHISDNAAILPAFVRVISLRTPKAPEFEVQDSETDIITVETKHQEQFDLAHVVLFADTADIADALDRATLEKAQLLRLPNRLDLYPNDGLRLRLKGGSILAPIASADTSTGILADGTRTISFALDLDYDQRVAVWALLLSRDGIPSRVNGPLVVTTGPEPLVAPTLSSVRSGNKDVLSWTALVVPAQIVIEQSLDAGANWQRISPWIQTGQTSFEHKSANVARSYRLVLKDQRNQSLTGPALNIAP